MKQPLHPKVTFQNSLYAPRFTPGTDGQIEWFTHDASWYTQLLLYSCTGSTTRAHWRSTKQEGPLSSSSSNVTFTHDSLSQRRIANECLSITTGCLSYYKCVSAADDRFTSHYITFVIWLKNSQLFCGNRYLWYRHSNVGVGVLGLLDCRIEKDLKRDGTIRDLIYNREGAEFDQHTSRDCTTAM